MGCGEIQSVSAASCSGVIRHVSCATLAFYPYDDLEDPFGFHEPDPEQMYESFIYARGGGGGEPPGDTPGGEPPDAPHIGDRPGGVDTPGGDVPDAPVDPGDPPPSGDPEFPGSGDVGPGPTPGGDPHAPGGPDAPGGEPPIIGNPDVAPWSFRRTNDADEYYTGDGSAANPFRIPNGTGGDDDKDDTETWLTALFDDVGQTPLTYEEI